MAGTKIGGLAAAVTNKARHGEGFYARVGAIGGKLGKTGGFYENRERARKAGALGGVNGKRGYERHVDELGGVTYTKKVS